MYYGNHNAIPGSLDLLLPRISKNTLFSFISSHFRAEIIKMRMKTTRFLRETHDVLCEMVPKPPFPHHQRLYGSRTNRMWCIWEHSEFIAVGSDFGGLTNKQTYVQCDNQARSSHVYKYRVHILG